MQVKEAVNLRGIKKELIDKFNNSPLYPLVNQDNDLLVCIRNNAIGIYHLADRVAMVRLDKNRELVCDVNDFYITGSSTGKEHSRTAKEISEKINVIKANSRKRITPEKNAQHNLILKNNLNPDSEWFCTDMEYRQSQKVQNVTEDAFNGRFDIIAVSKKSPYRIAVIELKYNSCAISGHSGIVKHIKDFNVFSKSTVCQENLKREIVCQLHNLSEIGVKVPESLLETPFDFAEKIEFYVITLWDDASDPKGTMGRYLFSNSRKNWVGDSTSSVSANNAMAEIGIDVENNPPFLIKFLFKRVQSPTEFDIDDILEDTLYDLVL